MKTKNKGENMKIVFMGTPDFALTVLKKLYEEKHEIIAVVTQTDKPKGRGHKIQFSPVKIFALEKNIPVLQPKTLKDNEFVDTLKSLNADIFIVAAYGKIIPENILYLTKYGSINVHASLLPKYRGAAPIHHAIINGETTTGITIMKMDKGMDTGDIILQKKCNISMDDTYETLYNKLSKLGADALTEVINNIDSIETKKQDDSLATYAPMITKDMGHIDWHKTSLEIANLIRALQPGAYTIYNDKILKIHQVENYPTYENAECGKIIDMNKNGFAIKTSDGALAILKLQKQGGKIMSAADYLKGHKLSTDILFN